MAKNTGTLIGATVRPTDSNDTYPVAFAWEIKGGRVKVSTRANLYALATAKPDYFEEDISIAVIESEDNKEIILRDYANRHQASGWVDYSQPGATDVETQITVAPVGGEDNKFVSRLKLFNWWGWVKANVQTISATWTFSAGAVAETYFTVKTGFGFLNTGNVRIAELKSSADTTGSYNRQYTLPDKNINIAGLEDISTDIIAVCGNELDDLIAGNGKLTMTIYRPCIIKAAYADVTTAATGSAIEVDVKKNGSTIFTTKPTIDANEVSSITGTTSTVLDATKVNLTTGDVLRFDLTQVGAITAGKGLKITLLRTLL